MGKGSPKTVQPIPDSYFAAIYAAEGMLNSDHKFLLTLLANARRNPETAEWNSIERTRIRIYNLTRQYTQAILALELYMRKA